VAWCGVVFSFEKHYLCSMKYKNMIFDFDGTLLDTAPVILATMQGTIAALGLPARTEQECRSTIGLRLEEIPAALFPEQPARSAAFAETYRSLFPQFNAQLLPQPFEGVSETLALLHARGVRMAIASSRSHESLQHYVTDLCWTDYFSLLVAGDDVREGKPAPEPVLTITYRLGWSLEETLVVGDAAFDIQMGKSAGSNAYGVSYGNGTLEELRRAGADRIIDRFEVLASL
jgi:phosphoglycolate phosphatase